VHRYALAEDLLFSPVGLEGEDVTPLGCKQALARGHHGRALLMALQVVPVPLWILAGHAGSKRDDMEAIAHANASKPYGDGRKLSAPLSLSLFRKKEEKTLNIMSRFAALLLVLLRLQLGESAGGPSAGGGGRLLTEVLETIPADAVPLVVRSIGGSGSSAATAASGGSAAGAVCRLVEALAIRLGQTRHLDFYLTFSLEVAVLF